MCTPLELFEDQVLEATWYAGAVVVDFDDDLLAGGFRHDGDPTSPVTAGVRQ